MMGRVLVPRAVFGVCVVVGIAVTTIAVISPRDALLFRAASGRVALETLVAVAGLVGLWVAGRRYRESDSAADLCLAAGLAVYVTAQLSLNAAPVVLELSEESGHEVAAASGRLLVAALIAAAAFLSRRPMDRRTRGLATASALLAIVATTAGAVVFLASGPSSDPGAYGSANLIVALREAPVTGLILCVGAALLAAASTGFWRRARSTGDGFWGWLAMACALGALAQVNSIVVPEGLDRAWISTGDLVRAATAAALAAAVVAELRAVWHRAAAVAVARERRRVARDLHDGVVQDLAFIISQSLSEPPAASSQERIAAAAERALESSRELISELTRVPGSIAEVIEGRAGPIASRWGMALHVDVDRHVALRPDDLEEVLGMVSEAISNAARHAGASNVCVELRPGVHDRIRLRITDDGAGFDPAGTVVPNRGGFGLVSMHERARALGGEMRLESEPGTGTIIEVAPR